MREIDNEKMRETPYPRTLDGGIGPLTRNLKSGAQADFLLVGAREISPSHVAPFFSYFDPGKDVFSIHVRCSMNGALGPAQRREGVNFLKSLVTDS